MTTDLTYTYPAYALAGAHPRNGRTYRTYEREHVSVTGLASVVGSLDVVALPERATIAVAADMLRRAVDITGMSRGQLRHALVETCKLVRHPDESVYRAAAMSLGIGSDEVDAVMSSADPWQARQHETQVTRSRKGRTSFKRTRVHIAPVIGDCHCPAGPFTDDAVTDDACLARDRAALSLRGARQLRLGWNALDVQRATDHHYRRLGVPALEGSDATSWARTTNGDRTSRTSVASHRSGIDGTSSHDGINAIAAPASEYVPNTGATMSWPLRGERSTGHKTTTYTKAGKLDQGFALPMGRERDRDPRDVRTFVCGPVRVRVTQRGSRIVARSTVCDIAPTWSLVAPTVDAEHRFIGHTLVKRPTVKRDARKTDVKRETATDIGTVDAPATVQGWSTLCDGLNRGDRVMCRADVGRVTVTRNARGYAATDTRDGQSVYWQSRTAEGIAVRLATV